MSKNHVRTAKAGPAAVIAALKTCMQVRWRFIDDRPSQREPLAMVPVVQSCPSGVRSTILPYYLFECRRWELSALRVAPCEVDEDGLDSLERSLGVRMLRRNSIRGKNLPGGLPFLSRREAQLTGPRKGRSTRRGFPPRGRCVGARRRSGLSHSRLRFSRGRPGFDGWRSFYRRGPDGFAFSRWRRRGLGVGAVIGAPEALEPALFEIVLVEAFAFAALAALVAGLLGMCGRARHDDERREYDRYPRYSSSGADETSVSAA